MHAATGTGLARDGTASVGRRCFSLSCPFSGTVFALCNGKATCGLPGAAGTLGRLSACWPKSSVPCQTWCFKALAAGTLCGYVFEEGPPQQGPHFDYISGVSVMPTPYTLPGIYRGGTKRSDSFWGGAAWLHPPWQLPLPRAGWALPASSGEKHSFQRTHVSFSPV